MKHDCHVRDVPGPSVDSLAGNLGEPLNREELAAVCKALGHPARLAIVEHLKGLDRCVCGDIVDRMPLAQSTVSQHLKVLKDAGLIRGAIDGPRTCYCLDLDVLARFKRTVADMLDEPDDA